MQLSALCPECGDPITYWDSQVGLWVPCPGCDSVVRLVEIQPPHQPPSDPTPAFHQVVQDSRVQSVALGLGFGFSVSWQDSASIGGMALATGVLRKFRPLPGIRG